MQLQLTGQLTGIEARNGGWFAVAFQEQGSNYPKKLSTKKPELIQQAQAMMGQWVDALYNESESSNINPNSGLPYMNRYLEAIAMAGQMPQQAPQQQPYPYTPPPSPPVQQQPQPGAYPYPMPPQPQGFAQQPAAQPFVPQAQFPPNVPQPQAQQAIVQQHSGVQMSELREDRIMRQSAAKVAVQLLDHLNEPDRTLASLVRISEQLVGYFRDGVQWSVPPVQNTSNPGYPPTQEQQGGGSEYNPGYAAVPGMVPADPGPQQGDPYHQPQGQAMPDDDIPFAPSIW